MNDQRVQELLWQADKTFQPAGLPAAPSAASGAAFVEAVHRLRQERQTRCRRLGVLGVVLIAGGFSSWAWVSRLGHGVDQSMEAVAAHDASEWTPERETTAAHPIAPTKRLGNDEIARLKAEIAALDAQADQARQFVELYRAAEARREILAAGEPALDEPLLPPAVVAQLGIDRAAAITVISADVQEKEFERTNEAAESYRSVLKNFPQSHWASVAKQRLLEIEHMN